MSEVCKAAGVSVNATRNRHLASTFFASLDMNEMDRKVFFDHMGHAEAINKENYQCPPGLQTLKVMGSVLQTLDGNAQFLF